MAERPNIVLILADDMGYGDFGCFNYGASRTPALDHLVREGVCLTQHYSASPVCAPARASLMTGRYPHRTGVIDTLETRGLDRLALREVTVAELLKRAGYATGLVGKWHNGAYDSRYHPNRRGFDEFAGFSGGWQPYYQWHLEAAPVGMVARIVRAVVPFPDQPGRVAGPLQEFGHGHLAQRQPVEPARLQRIDDAGAMRITAGHQRGSRRRTNGRSRVVLGETDSLAHEMIERRRSRRAVVEASEVAITHVVGENQDDVRPFGHSVSLNRFRITKKGPGRDRIRAP